MSRRCPFVIAPSEADRAGWLTSASTWSAGRRQAHPPHSQIYYEKPVTMITAFWDRKVVTSFS